MAVQQTRSICKAFGVRLPSASTDGFTAKMESLIPELLRPALAPVLVTVTHLSRSIQAFDKLLAKLAAEHYPEVQRLQQIDGIGPVISVAFALSVEDPKRFASSRQVGSWLGLCPRSRSSGDSSPQLRISKAGDGRLRRLLTQGAQRILGPFGTDCDLRRFGLQIAARGGKSAKKRALVAVARKLAVLMHKLWLTGRDYEPLHRPTDAQRLQCLRRSDQPFFLPPPHHRGTGGNAKTPATRTHRPIPATATLSRPSRSSRRLQRWIGRISPCTWLDPEPHRVRMEVCEVRPCRGSGASA
jgi:hypothetical protein